MRKPVMPCKGWKNKPNRKGRGMKGFRNTKVKPNPQKVRRFLHMGRSK